jgi:hypothetical protein
LLAGILFVIRAWLARCSKRVDSCLARVLHKYIGWDGAIMVPAALGRVNQLQIAVSK